MATADKQENLIAGIVRNLYSGITNFAFKKRSLRVKDRDDMFQHSEEMTQDVVSKLESLLHITIQTTSYFQQALTHRSFLQVKISPERRSNERLEFLGDSILGMIVAEYLFDQHRQVQEGELTKMRSWLVNKKSLAICARHLKLDEMMLISFSAKQMFDKGNDSILADCLEAVIAAIYLDSGLDASRQFIEEVLLPIMMNESLMRDTNFKSTLLEYVQSYGKPSPHYVVVNEIGPDHDKTFTVGAYVMNDCVGIGEGKTKKDAEQMAAKKALDSVFARR